MSDGGGPAGGGRAANWVRVGFFGFVSGITVDFVSSVVLDRVPLTPITLVVAVGVGFTLALVQDRRDDDPPVTGRDTAAAARPAWHHRWWQRQRDAGDQARAMAEIARRAERSVPPIVLVELEGSTQGWAGRRGQSFAEGYAELTLNMDDTARALTLHPPAGAAWRLRRWWFRAARARCAWLATDPPLERGGRPVDTRREWVEVCEAARRLGGGARGGAMERWANAQLGVLHRLAGEHDQALERLTEALPTRGNWADPQVHTDVGLVHLDRGDVELAIRHLERARSHRSRRDHAGRAVTEAALGLAYRARAAPGDEDQGRALLWDAARRVDDLGERALATALRTAATG